ncbi:MAG: hypothetical protein ACI3XL_02200, partial [Eubacteriales bacterium]
QNGAKRPLGHDANTTTVGGDVLDAPPRIRADSRTTTVGGDVPDAPPRIRTGARATNVGTGVPTVRPAFAQTHAQQP